MRRYESTADFKARIAEMLKHSRPVAEVVRNKNDREHYSPSQKRRRINALMKGKLIK